jgi:ParB family chromosome partitioning protein
LIAGVLPVTDSWPARQIAMRAVSELIPYARNSRTHSEAQIAQVAAAMQEWGWTNPVLVDEAGTILAGHCRVTAARVLGITEVPTMTAIGWSDAQKRAYVIADNKLAENAGWDPEMLRLELSDLASGAFNLDMLGFAEGALSLALADPEFEPADITTQSRLDEKARVACPSCGHEFEPK